MRRTRRRLFLLAGAATAASTLLALAGCGGGHDREPPGSDAQYPLATTTRQLQAGDQWTYEVRTNNKRENYDYRVFVTSPLTLQDTSAQLIEVKAFRSSDPSERIEQQRIFTQNTASGDIVQTGKLADEAGETRIFSLTQPQRILPGMWTAGGDFSYAFVYDPSAPYPEQEVRGQIVGAEAVQTPLGTFDTWKVVVDSIDRQNVREPDFFHFKTFWYAPQLGAYVKREDRTVGWEQNDLTRTYTLSATTVPLGPTK